MEEVVYVSKGCWWPRFTAYDRHTAMSTGPDCSVLLGELVGEQPRELLRWIGFALYMPFLFFSAYKVVMIGRTCKDWRNSVPFGLWIRLLLQNLFAALLVLDVFEATEFYPIVISVLFLWTSYFMTYNIIIFAAYQMWIKILAEIHKDMSSTKNVTYGRLLTGQVVVATLISQIPTKNGTFNGAQWFVFAFEGTFLGSINLWFAFKVLSELSKSQKEMEAYRKNKSSASPDSHPGSGGFVSQSRKIKFLVLLETTLMILMTVTYIIKGSEMISRDQTHEFEKMFQTKSFLLSEYYRVALFSIATVHGINWICIVLFMKSSATATAGTQRHRVSSGGTSSKDKEPINKQVLTDLKVVAVSPTSVSS